MFIYDNFPWLRNRELRIFEIISELLLFIVFLIINNTNFGSFNIPYLIAFILFWIPTNYIFGRYVSVNNFKKFTLLKNLFSIIISIIIIYFSYFFISIFFYIHNGYRTDSIDFYEFFIKYAILNYFLHSSYLIIYSKKFSATKHLIFICREELKEKIKSLFTKSTNNLKIKFSTIETLDLSNLLKYQEIIYEDVSFSKNLKSKGLYKSKKVINYIEWIEQNIQIFPFQLLNRNEILNIFDKIIPLKNQLIIKRIGDILCSVVILLFSSPLIFIFSFLIYFEDKGPVIYSQIRTGQFEKQFKIYKLRSMRIDAEQFGAQWARKYDDRITKIGVIIRKFRIDELPQLWNVIKGDMSLIGPRPERPEFDKVLKDKIPNYELRFKMKPGLSGWAQVNHPYGASLQDSSNKLSYDLFYMKNFSILIDILILFKTIHLVITAKGGSPNE